MYNKTFFNKLFVQFGIDHRFLKLKRHWRMFNEGTEYCERWDFIDKEDFGGTFLTTAFGYQHSKTVLLSLNPSYDVESNLAAVEIKLTKAF